MHFVRTAHSIILTVPLVGIVDDSVVSYPIVSYRIVSYRIVIESLCTVLYVGVVDDGVVQSTVDYNDKRWWMMKIITALMQKQMRNHRIIPEEALIATDSFMVLGTNVVSAF